MNRLLLVVFASSLLAIARKIPASNHVTRHGTQVAVLLVTTWAA